MKINNLHQVFKSWCYNFEYVMLITLWCDELAVFCSKQVVVCAWIYGEKSDLHKLYISHSTALLPSLVVYAAHVCVHVCQGPSRELSCIKYGIHVQNVTRCWFCILCKFMEFMNFLWNKTYLWINDNLTYHGKSWQHLAALKLKPTIFYPFVFLWALVLASPQRKSAYLAEHL